MNLNLKEVIKDYKIFVDTCSLMSAKEEFFLLDVSFELRKQNKKLYILSNVKNELIKHKNFKDKEEIALKGLRVIDTLEKNELLEIIKCDNDHHADLELVKIFLNEVQDTNLCLFTEDRDLAKDISLRVKSIESTRINNDICCIKVATGKLIRWSDNDLMKYSTSDEVAKYQTMNNSNNVKLLIDFVIDNSASMKGNKIVKLKNSLMNFHNNIINANLKDSIEYSITVFNGLECKLLKKYEDFDLDVDGIFEGGIPYVNDAILYSLDALEQRKEHLTKAGYQLHKSWCMVMLNGENYGEVVRSIEKITTLHQNGVITYMPIMLSYREVSPTLRSLKKLKNPWIVKNDMYDEMFKWIFDLAQQRATKPLGETLKIDAQALEGWTIKG